MGLLARRWAQMAGCGVAAGTLGARLVVAGTHSGVGKTTVTTGILAALKKRGLEPACAKVGPDFIDPSYHSLACGRPPRNLDPWLCGPQAMGPLAARAAIGADLLVIEGVMGLFDGAVDGSCSSTGDLAALLEAPVVLVVDASAMSGSVAALVHGFASFRPGLRVGGVVLNRVGSPGHRQLLLEALAPLGIPVLGALPKDPRFVWRDRHLGLVPVAEARPQALAALDALAEAVGQVVDLEAVVALARSAPPRSVGEVALPERGPAARIGLAVGRAFSFTYQDTLDAALAAGAEIVPFDPLQDRHLPAALDGLLIGGGFPEVYAEALSDNEAFLEVLRRAAASGLVIWAECGGLLLLCERLEGKRLAGVVAAEAHMTERLTIGYREAQSTAASPIGPAGTSFRGHEFHYSTLSPPGGALVLSSRFGVTREGFANPDLLATYLHYHPGGDPGPVAAFVRRAALRHALHS